MNLKEESPTDSIQQSKQKGQFVKLREPYFYRYTGSGAYYAIFRHESKLIKRCLKTTDKELAKRRLEEFRREITRIDLSQNRMTLEDLLELYRTNLKTLDLKTVETRLCITRVFERKWPKGMRQQVKDVKPSEIRSWIANLPKIRDRQLSNSTKNEYLRFLRQMFSMAVENKVIVDSPVAGLKELKRQKPLRSTPNYDEFLAIVKDIRSQIYHADAEDSADFVEFLGLSGLGNSEAANLMWQDVNWTRKKIRVFRNKTDQGFEIPIFPQLLPLLQKLKGDITPDGAQRILKIENAKKALTSACKRLGLPHYTHRALRRFFITHALEQGIPFHVVASWQGHRDGGRLIATTYGHLRTEYADQMAQKMNLLSAA